MTGEEQARREIGVTRVTRRMALALTMGFCAIIGGVAASQFFLPAPVTGPARSAAPSERASRPPRGAGLLASIVAASDRLSARAADFETRLADRAWTSRVALPMVRSWFAWRLRGGTEGVIVGHGGWLFHAPDVKHVTGPAFLEAADDPRGRGRSRPDPIGTIADFARQLRALGIDLVVVPVPSKASIHGDEISATAAMPPAVLNASHADFVEGLARQGVTVVDLLPDLSGLRAESRNAFLRTDSHWSPDGVEVAAAAIARAIRAGGKWDSGGEAFTEETLQVRGAGDVLALLGLSKRETELQSESVLTRPVTPTGDPPESRPEAPVLLLGDSFSNIYSRPEMGWGGSAGLPERLAVHLSTRVDVLARNDAGAIATRRALAAELRSGGDRLKGKRVVVWQFAARELSFGDWERVEIAGQGTSVNTWCAPEAGRSVIVEATVAEVASPPPAGSTPYPEHLVQARLIDLRSRAADLTGREAVVLALGMKDHRWTGAGTWKVGERVTVEVRPWQDAENEWGTLGVNYLDAERALLEACWAEPLETSP